MRVEEINERSVLLARQSSALTFLLNKFKNTKRSFGYRLCQIEVSAFQSRTAYSQTVVQNLKKRGANIQTEK